MSTPNFTTQNSFKLFLWDYNRKSDEDIDREILESGFNEIENAENITESDRDEFSEHDFYWECRDIVDNFDETVKEVLHTCKRSLNFFKVTLKDGYYCGLQFYVEIETGSSYGNEILGCSFNVDRDEEITDITNDDTKDYFGMYRSEFLRKFYSEIRFINKKVLPKLAKIYGFEEYYCKGIFSNGEAIYSKVEKTQRSQVLQAVA